MSNIYSWDGIVPVIDPAAFVHPQAVIIGDVQIGADVYVGPCAVLRGDFGRITVQAGANIQENCVVHAFPGKDVLVEEGGHVGHGAVLHGCHIGRNAMVGMNAVVMDDASLGENSILGALSFVKAGAVIPPGSLALGSPARVVRPLSADEIAWKTEGTAIYRQLAGDAPSKLVPVVPLTAPEPDRRRVEVAGYQTLLARRAAASERI
jgi:phenylacetic acid degradation protein